MTIDRTTPSPNFSRWFTVLHFSGYIYISRSGVVLLVSDIFGFANHLLFWLLLKLRTKIAGLHHRMYECQYIYIHVVYLIHTSTAIAELDS